MRTGYSRSAATRSHPCDLAACLYIGKESDKHWEEGEDLSLLDFKGIEYKRKGNAVADEEQLARIAKVPKREFIRRGIISTRLRKFVNGSPYVYAN